MPSIPATIGCTGGGPLVLEICGGSSSNSDLPGIDFLNWLLDCNGCSFVGGTGPKSWDDASAPRGPSGSTASSNASNFVDCSSMRRGVRGVRGSLAAGDLGTSAEDALSFAGVDFGFDCSV